jgi:hypothetical protein
MPRFFFDITDTGKASPDGEGTEFPDLHAARAAALRTLGEIAKDELPDGDFRDFVIAIRQDDGPVLLSASLSLKVATS